MADVTVLRCWPACVDAIDWSPDGIIALASDERIELLFPNTVDFDRDQVLPQWQHVPLKVPLFSIEELPLKEPAPIPNYSIGEEISNSAPVSIAWSPSGLAKHRKCALAVLTANLTLSIWSAQGKPQDESSWARRLIINDALVEHFSGRDDEPSHLTAPYKERLRLRSRIRTFAWAPALSCSEPAGIIGTRLLYSRHILAVSNDDNHLVFVAVESPTSTLGVERDWKAEVLEHKPLVPGPNSIFPDPTAFEDMMQQQRYISHIAWSPWVVRGDVHHSVVVYATNEDVRARIVKHGPGRMYMEDEVVYSGLELRYEGPMRWSPKVQTGDRLKLALFTNSGLVCLTISTDDASILQKETHDLDGRWDQVSGATWDPVEESSPRLHISSLLSTLNNPTSVLEASSDGLKCLGIPSWREKIENNLALFSVKNGLKGNSKAKVWGLSTSPLGNFIAACHSVHPSDMIEYGIPADRSGTVAISSLRHGIEQREPFPRDNVSAEGVTYTIRKLAEDTVEDPDEMPAFADDMIQKLTQAYTAPVVPEHNAGTSTLHSDVDDLNSLIKVFKIHAFLDPNTLKDRYTILVSLACKTASSHELPRTLIAYRLANALTCFPSSLSHPSFSMEILAQHKQIIKLLNNVISDGSADVETPATHGALTAGFGPDDDASQTTQVFAAAWEDSCDFCSAPIPFSDLNSASCMNGHQFPRCGLSFLAIQAPGITKYCGICSTPFLSDEFVMAQEFVETGKNEETTADNFMTDIIDNGDRPTNGDAGYDDNDSMDTTKEDGTHNVRGREGQEQTDEASEEPDIVDLVEEEEDAEDNPRDLPVTLARVLFLACDACIYCGGKFVG